MYIDVILPLPLAGTFTYGVPEEMNVQPKPGMRVIVPFGKKKMYTAVVYSVHIHDVELNYAIKDIICFLDDAPVLRHTQLKFWDWISDYYMAPLGDVYKAALPSAMKLESETKVVLNDDFEAEEPLPAHLQKILFLLSDNKPHALGELSRRLEVKNLMPSLNRLVSINAVFIDEMLTAGYKPKVETCIVLHPRFSQKEQLQSAFSELAKAPKQMSLLMYYLDLSGFMQTGKALEISKKTLIEKSKATTALLNNLVQRNIFVQSTKRINRLTAADAALAEEVQLNDAQKLALQQINSSFVQKDIVLLHGITSSGKTELYIKLINQALAQGKQVLYLVPEIALTTQLTSRLQVVFGKQLGVYHSKFSDAERVEIYQNLLKDDGYNVILGVRSSVFLPFRQLGLIIVDEEHEGSYKQQDPSPRYNARNAAIVLARMHGAKTLLGTATPSVETYFNAKNGRYGLVELHSRYKDILLPEINVVDTKEAYRKKLMTGHFSDELVEKMQAALQRKEQIILFQNRRGYAPYVECKACGTVPKCPHCDVSLTVHKMLNIMVCHYCGYTQSLIHKCPACGSNELTDRGFGTEMIEDEIKQLFPDVRVMRMDLDTTRSRNSYQKIISDFEQHKVDVLVGTQMVSKGLNFNDVSLVAVLNADNLLHQPDFRAYERAFQMLEQVSGRAGRMHGRGEVVLQTSNPENMVIQKVVEHDYAGLYQNQIAEREMFRYPPYFRLLQIEIKHRDVHKLDEAAKQLAANLQHIFGNRCSQVVIPVIGRIQNLYIRQILLRIEVAASVVKAKELLRNQIEWLHQNSDYKETIISVDVDPV